MTDTPVLRQYREAKSQHPDAILLFRLGDFFEIFFEDAQEAAPIMGVTLTSRPMGKGGRHPMCGVPYHAWQSYVGKLLRAGRKVVICDQVEAATAGRIVRREVTRVLTPGTVVDEAYLEPGRSNYLVAAWTKGGEGGLAACEVSTGELLLCQLPSTRLQAELDRLAPAELLAPPEVDEYKFDPERGRGRLKDLLGVAHLESIGAESAPLAVGAAGVVLDYLQRNQARLGPGLLRVRTYSAAAGMQLDAATLRNLELPALLKLVDHTVTPMGARRLRSWLWSPLTDVESIRLRLAAVSELVEQPRLRDGLRQSLSGLGDLERLLSRAAQALAGPRELVALGRALEAAPGVAGSLEGAASPVLRQLAGRLGVDGELAGRLAAALVENPPAHSREPGSIRPGFDAELDRIREASRSAREWIAELEAAERERTGIKTLKVGYNRVFGYYIEVSQAASAQVPAEYIRKQTLSGAERYVTPEMKERETIVLNAQQDTLAREQEILLQLYRLAAASAGPVLETAAAAAELDALASLAEAASANGWVRPEIHLGPRLEIRAGRHPVVEASLPAGTFVPNDLLLDSDGEQVMILTGPNMAGKSTYLRQAALIVLLAQCGSHVPAASAAIGIADRIFTRVGAHDDLAAGMSTFMVEMTETANILNHASRDSLVILDEVGRGTSTYDGVSIAIAIVSEALLGIGCRTLFATHYHELTALAQEHPRVANHRVEVAEEGESIRFLHQVVPGGADRSYGIHVAALAGLPRTVLARARQILADLESRAPIEAREQQLGLPLEAPPDELRLELEGLELDRLSPLEALQKLYEIKSRAKRD